jgi:hypothetical protein
VAATESLPPRYVEHCVFYAEATQWYLLMMVLFTFSLYFIPNFESISYMLSVTGELGVPVESGSRTLVMYLECGIHAIDAMVNNFDVARVQLFSYYTFFNLLESVIFKVFFM